MCTQEGLESAQILTYVLLFKLIRISTKTCFSDGDEIQELQSSVLKKKKKTKLQLDKKAMKTVWLVFG